MKPRPTPEDERARLDNHYGYCTAAPNHRGPCADVWWCVSGSGVLNALHRAAAGDDPGVVYAEMYANARREDCSGDSGMHALDAAYEEFPHDE